MPKTEALTPAALRALGELVNGRLLDSDSLTPTALRSADELRNLLTGIPLNRVILTLQRVDGLIDAAKFCRLLKTPVTVTVSVDHEVGDEGQTFEVRSFELRAGDRYVEWGSDDAADHFHGEDLEAVRQEAEGLLNSMCYRLGQEQVEGTTFEPLEKQA